MDKREFSGRTIDEALTAATVELGVTSDRLDYEVIEKGSSGFLGLGSKEAVIRVSIKGEEPESTAFDNTSALQDEITESSDASAIEEASQSESSSCNDREDTPVDVEAAVNSAKDFLASVFSAMDIEVELDIKYDDEDRSLSINMSGPEMGIIIGKRGQTLDSLQYITNLAVNRSLDSYVRVKMDTEDYRKRRKATLENLAKNVAYKVKRNKRPVSLEAMNPYERRVIHYALQHDSYVTTYSEGEEPYRHVVVALK